MRTDQNTGRVAVITGASSRTAPRSSPPPSACSRSSAARTSEPGAIATELSDHITHADSKRAANEALDWSNPPHDIADVIAFAVSRPQRVTLNEILVRPTQQAM